MKEKLRHTDCGCRDRIVSGQAFSKYQCVTCGDSDMHMNTDVPDMCDSCAAQLKVCAWCKKSIKS